MIDFDQILTEAREAATRAQATQDANLPPEEHRGFDCGFAWVTVPGNTPLARHCRKAGKAERFSEKFYGSKGYSGGWKWWRPGNHYTGQSISVFEAGARAFRDTLAKHGIVAEVHSRLD